jgi:hypothetical protein
MNVVVLLPDGVGVRNFLLGSFCRQLTAVAHVCVLHDLPNGLENVYRTNTNSTRWERLIGYRETPLSFTLRWSVEYGQMYWADTPGMRLMREIPVKGSWRTRAARRVAQFAGMTAATRRGIRVLERTHRAIASRMPEVEHYCRLFREFRPSVLFCSHQRPPEVLPAVLAARALCIPTATFIFSWDNLTSKGRIAAPFDHYLVWSDHMRRELLRYYPDVSDDRVHIVGTPQFDPYWDATLLWDRAAFFQRINADASRPLICYSGGDVGTCPDDPEHVRTLAQLIQAGRIGRRPQLIVRPAPVDESARFESVLRDHPDIIFARPAWTHSDGGRWSDVAPSAEDVQFLANLTHHADLNVNHASTMTLDFAIHDKPVVNLAFAACGGISPGATWQHRFYEFEHYQPVLRLGAARVARSPYELAHYVSAYLEDPSLDRAGRRALVDLELGGPPGRSAEAIVTVLHRIARVPPSIGASQAAARS